MVLQRMKSGSLSRQYQEGKSQLRIRQQGPATEANNTYYLQQGAVAPNPHAYASKYNGIVPPIEYDIGMLNSLHPTTTTTSQVSRHTTDLSTLGAASVQSPLPDSGYGVEYSSQQRYTQAQNGYGAYDQSAVNATNGGYAVASAPLEAIFDGYQTKDANRQWKTKYLEEVQHSKQLEHQVVQLQDEVQRLKKQFYTSTYDLQNELHDASERNVKVIQQCDAAMFAMKEQLEQAQINLNYEKRIQQEALEELEQHKKLDVTQSSECPFDIVADSGDRQLYGKEVARLNKLLTERESELEMLKELAATELSALQKSLTMAIEAPWQNGVKRDTPLPPS
eukprot:GEMP01055968.1.p1 GENE.GEMP01055968.1~~GEMP01055968.1.p1  ORF type:complete len:387 (+),score=99.51 GEMP01055968.1:154-1161(+)